jgi:hypothetical protein
MNNLEPIIDKFGDLSPWQAGPDFWVAGPKDGLSLLEQLKPTAVTTIGRSAGGREILAVEYGEREDHGARMDNLHSAIMAKLESADPTEIYPEAFYGAARRSRPVLAIQSGIHGGEVTGTVAGFNLCRVIETGEDLRGNPWPRLAELARDARILFIPWLNIDGATRFPIPHCSGAPATLLDRLVLGVRRDGEPYRYPEAKCQFPIPPEDVAFMGAYYNDAGVNLQYDFTTVTRQPETVAWMIYYLLERPDGLLICHCNAGSMIDVPEYYLPPGHQHLLSRLGGAVRSRLLREGFAIGRTSLGTLPGLGKPFLSQIGATYHVCGGTPLLCEFPIGTREYFFTPDQMLDIGLITLEEVLEFAHRDGFRPYEVREKILKRETNQ